MSTTVTSQPSLFPQTSKTFKGDPSTGGGIRIRQTEEVKTKVSTAVQDAKIAAKRYLPDFDVQDKVVVVTGGGRGLGLTMAVALYQAGAIGKTSSSGRARTRHWDY